MAASALIKINVKQCNEVQSLEVAPSDTVLSIKQKLGIYGSCKIQRGKQNLKNECTLSYYNIADGCTLSLYKVKQPGQFATRSEYRRHVDQLHKNTKDQINAHVSAESQKVCKEVANTQDLLKDTRGLVKDMHRMWFPEKERIAIEKKAAEDRNSTAEVAQASDEDAAKARNITAEVAEAGDEDAAKDRNSAAEVAEAGDEDAEEERNSAAEVAEAGDEESEEEEAGNGESDSDDSSSVTEPDLNVVAKVSGAGNEDAEEKRNSAAEVAEACDEDAEDRNSAAVVAQVGDEEADEVRAEDRNSAADIAEAGAVGLYSDDWHENIRFRQRNSAAEMSRSCDEAAAGIADDTSECEPQPKRARVDAGLSGNGIYADFLIYKTRMEEKKYTRALLNAKIAKRLHKASINLRTCTRMLQTDLSLEEREAWDICYRQHTEILKDMSQYLVRGWM